MVLNWHISRGYIIIPKTVTESRLPENINVFDFELSEEEKEAIAGLDQNLRFFNPINYPKWDFLPYFE